MVLIHNPINGKKSYGKAQGYPYAPLDFSTVARCWRMIGNYIPDQVVSSRKTIARAGSTRRLSSFAAVAQSLQLA